MELTMFCPVCAGEYREGFTRCADCDVALEAEPPDEAPAAARDGDPHDLVAVLDSSDVEILSAALVRLTEMAVPHQIDTDRPAGTRRQEWADGDRVRILVVRGRLDQARRCLTLLEESVAATVRELARHGFKSMAVERAMNAGERRAGVHYCGRCGSSHRDLPRCVDCDLPLVAERPAWAEAEPLTVFTTLDRETLAAARRRLAAAGIACEWGCLAVEDAPGEGGLAASLLVPAGHVQVATAQGEAARAVLRPLADAAAGGGGRLDDEDADEQWDADAAAATNEDEGFQYCPRCGGEFRAEVTHCPDCAVTLAASPPPSTGPAPLVHDPGERCANCGGVLPAGSAICARCSPPDDEEAAVATSLAPSRSGSSAAGGEGWWAIAAGLPGAREDHVRIGELYRAACFLAGIGIVLLPWVTELQAFVKAGQARALIRSYGEVGQHPLERGIARVRALSLAWLAVSWLGLAAGLALYFGFPGRR
jgi:hypothetical protein